MMHCQYRQKREEKMSTPSEDFLIFALLFFAKDGFRIKKEKLKQRSADLGDLVANQLSRALEKACHCAKEVLVSVRRR
jgi:hypothetical protein